MANLDDFFKKKDGKKNPTSKKFAVNNPLSLSSSENVKNGKMKQEKPTSFNHARLSHENDLGLFSSQQTDEWKDFVEEKKDYSGLKIQNLQINENDADKFNAREQESEDETEIDDCGQTIIKKKQPSGPWKVVPDQKKEVQKPPEKKEVPPPPPPPSQPIPERAYVVPAKRNVGFERETPSLRTTKNTDISSKEMFPELGSTVPSSNQTSKK